jgi:cytochrome P450
MQQLLVEARTKNPGDDFVSALVNARDVDGDNDALDLPEATSIMLMMLFAGHETTTNLLGNSFHRLLADRASWEAICREPGLIPNAIEEVLRFDSSVITWRHKAKQAVDIGGVQVPAQAKLLLLLGSANRDPAIFADPDRFDIRRPNAREHLWTRRAQLPRCAARTVGGARGVGGGQPTPTELASRREHARVPCQHLDARAAIGSGRMVRSVCRPGGW